MDDSNKNLIQYLSQFVSENRLNKFNQIIDERTRHLTVVLEDIYQAHNASAVLRSCDCFGIQDVHFIENRNKYKISTDVDMGASSWLSINRYSEKDKNNTLDCIEKLKNRGYRIVATTPHEKDCTLDQLEINSKTALVFGTEIEGISEEVRNNADAFVRIPMFGFTESFNISVSAALSMYELSSRIRKSQINYKLTEQEKEEILVEWMKSSIKRCDLIINDYHKKQKNITNC